MLKTKLTFMMYLQLVIFGHAVLGQDTTPPVIECPGSQNQGIAADCSLSPAFASCTENLCINDVEIFNSSGEIIMSNTGTGCSGTDGFILYQPLEGQTTASLIPGESYTIRVAAPDSVLMRFHIRLQTIGIAYTGSPWPLDPPVFVNEFEFTFEIPSNANQGSVFLRVVGNPFWHDWSCSGTSGMAEVEQYILFIDRGFPSDYCNVLPDYSSFVGVSDDTDLNPITSQYPAPGSTIGLNGTMVELTATDNAGNSSSCEFMVYRSDLNFPTITCPESISIVGQILDSTWVEIPLPVVFDNCGDVQVVNNYNNSENASDYFFDGYQEIIFVATDVAGNRSECSMSIWIPSLDTIAPEIMCPMLADTFITAVSAECTPAFLYGCQNDMVEDVVIRDTNGNVIMSHENTQCTGDFYAYSEFLPSEGITTCTLNFGHSYTIGVNSFVFAQFFIAFIDYNNDGQFNANEEHILSSISPSLNKSAQFTIPSNNILPGLHRLRVIAQFSYPNFDLCDTSAYGETHDYLINLQPNWPESFCNVLPDFTSYIVVSDNEDINPSIVQTPQTGTIIQDSVVVTLVATDFANNTSSCWFTVYPYDTTPPTIQCIDTLVMSGVNTDSMWVEVPSPIYYDNCSETSLLNDYTNDVSANGYYYQGTTEVLFSASDNAENLSTCQTAVILIPVNQACVYDLNSDGNVDVTDLIILLENFGCIEDCEYDFNGDGIIGSDDITTFLGFMGLGCN